jgi:hypothetical protein
VLCHARSVSFTVPPVPGFRRAGPPVRVGDERGRPRPGAGHGDPHAAVRVPRHEVSAGIARGSRARRLLRATRTVRATGSLPESFPPAPTWTNRDSNPEPPPCQSGAQPVELQAHGAGCGSIVARTCPAPGSRYVIPRPGRRWCCPLAGVLMSSTVEFSTRTRCVPALGELSNYAGPERIELP